MRTITARRVSTHSRLKAAGGSQLRFVRQPRSFNTQPPEGGWESYSGIFSTGTTVSTHSRLKAAGQARSVWIGTTACFNTQPPEGGWGPSKTGSSPLFGFNTQPPEGGWIAPGGAHFGHVCFNTQPPEGGWAPAFIKQIARGVVSTHSRLKAAGSTAVIRTEDLTVSTHSRLKAAGFCRLALSVDV